jgi:hypothetical protein
LATKVEPRKTVNFNIEQLGEFLTLGKPDFSQGMNPKKEMSTWLCHP